MFTFLSKPSAFLNNLDNDLETSYKVCTFSFWKDKLKVKEIDKLSRFFFSKKKKKKKDEKKKKKKKFIVHTITLKRMSKFAAYDISNLIFFFSKNKTRQTIHMKCKALFSLIIKQYFKLSSA